MKIIRVTSHCITNFEKALTIAHFAYFAGRKMLNISSGNNRVKKFNQKIILNLSDLRNTVAKILNKIMFHIGTLKCI